MNLSIFSELSYIVKKCWVQSISHSQIKDSNSVFTIHKRWHRKKIKRRLAFPPVFHVPKTRKHYEENLTSENEEFLSEVIEDQYGYQPSNAGGIWEPFASPLKDAPWPKGEWKENSIRCGLIARKIGIYPLWSIEGKRFLTTLLHVVDNHVIKYYSPEEYEKILSPYEFRHYKRKQTQSLACLIVGAQSADPRLFTKNYCSLFTNVGLMPKRILTRFHITPNAAIQPGTPLFASHFRVGDVVDIYGRTTDRGHQGVMKRWGFAGMPATHGVTKSHRRGGNIGSGGEKGRVWPGTKMPGRMGFERRTLRGQRILRINTRYNIIWVQGPAIPGPTNCYVFIHDTLLPLRKYETPPPFPTWYEGEESFPENIYMDGMHAFDCPSVTFENWDIDKERYKIPTFLNVYKRYP